MIRVEITNYESIEHAVIEIDGFTTVVGPNYSGKSAAMRAINAALTNQSGMEFVRWGQTYCEVRIQAPGLDLLWHKEEGNNHYVVNGNTYGKIGRDEPPAEVAALGYGAVKVSGQKHELHYADQFTPLFLVDDQNTKTADLVASVYGLDRLYKASELCSKDQRSNGSLLKIRRKDLENAREDLKRFEGLDDVLREAERLKGIHTDITSTRAQIDRATTWAQSMSRAAVECKRLKPASDIDLPDGGSLGESAGRLQEAKRLLSRIEEVAGAERRLKSATGVALPDAASTGIAASIRKMGAARAYMESLRSGREAITGIKAQISECQSELDDVEKERASFKRCPLCNQELKAA